MKRFLPFAMLLMTGALVAPSAKADITSRMQSSIQLQVNAAATQVSRIGSTYSASGSGVTMDVGGGNSADGNVCLLYTSPSPRDRQKSRMPSSA